MHFQLFYDNLMLIQLKIFCAIKITLFFETYMKCYEENYNIWTLGLLSFSKYS